MGCWFACLRFKAERRSPAPSSVDTTPCKSRDRLVSRKKLTSVFAPEGSPCDGGDLQDSIKRELKTEAKYLKSCGALLETPKELANASFNCYLQGGNEDSVKSHSSLYDSSCKRLQWDGQPDEVPCSLESRAEGHPSVDNTQSMYSIEKQQTPSIQRTVRCGLSSPLSSAAVTMSMSVKFGSVGEDNEVELNQNAAPKASPQNHGRVRSPSSMFSPYPTPLKLTDEMETPGTVYPVKGENFGVINNTWVRSQYVYPVVDPMLNRSDKKAINEAIHHLDQSSVCLEQQVRDINSPVVKSELQSTLRPLSVNLAAHHNSESSHLNENVVREAASHDNSRLNVDSSITSYFDSVTFDETQQVEVTSVSPKLFVSTVSQLAEFTDQHEGRVKLATAGKGRSPPSRSPAKDRPIIGMVAAHWSSDEKIRASPKSWDGNGIPNSTNKYKEDQRVSWHATPFEERLEKVLSEEKIYPHRNPLNLRLEELGEGDTATSKEKDEAKRRITYAF